jgi:hypothetical protein
MVNLVLIIQPSSPIQDEIYLNFSTTLATSPPVAYQVPPLFALLAIHLAGNVSHPDTYWLQFPPEPSHKTKKNSLNKKHRSSSLLAPRTCALAFASPLQ